MTYDGEWWANIWSIHRFRPSLASRHFTVAADQKPLGSSNIDSGSDPTGRTARWAIE